MSPTIGTLAAVVAILYAGCSRRPAVNLQAGAEDERHDYHSYGNPHQIKVAHVHLNLDVNFEASVLSGIATLTVERARLYPEGPLFLDTRDLTISSAGVSADGTTYAQARFEVAGADPILGSKLTIHLPHEARFVRIAYTTSPKASGLQWLTPAQTAGKKHPFLYTQSQAIHARSWIPLQDSPGVRVSYSARIRTPKHLLAVMSAENQLGEERPGDYSFRMPQPIPSYLIALAVGDLKFRAISSRTGVFAEPSVVRKAAKEFEDVERMMQAAEELYGPYRWERYDILVLPPSFPFGGMENPRLTFVTPTLLAGDKSLVGVIAHELAHSWSGNLVTNATWRDFWLNEGFTVYLEQRIQEKVFGPERAEMEAALEKQGLDREMADLPERDEILHIDLKGRDPDAAFTEVPYVKGMLFLRSLEETFGREQFDPFLRGYFERFTFQSLTTDDFVRYLNDNLLAGKALAKRIPVKEWVYQPGLPANAPKPVSQTFKRVESAANRWAAGQIAARAIPTRDWTTQEWLHFLRALPPQLERSRMAELDRAFQFTRSGNSEILYEWMLIAVRNRYEAAYPRLEEFLTSVGRRKYLKPLYTELAKSPDGLKRAREIYQKAKPGYHPIAVATVDQILFESRASLGAAKQ
ncbi:MAG: M1 family metallopeptidase [Acidobacteria bacterium]|nr:M1 family metallopeptidase [Acidobacteriota bacterium]